MKIMGQKVTFKQWLIWKLFGREYYFNKMRDR